MGPQIGATRVVMDQMPSAVPRFSGGKIEISSAWLPGIIGPDTPPCRTRKKISDGRLQAMPHRNDATVKARTEKAKVRTTPVAAHQPAGQRHADAIGHGKGGDHPGALAGGHAQIARRWSATRR